MILNVTDRTHPVDSFSVNKNSKSDEAVSPFSILSDEVGEMMDEKGGEEASEYASIFTMEADRQAQLNRMKLEAEGNPFKDQNLPDGIYNKIKELFPGNEVFSNTKRAWFGLMLTGNAIEQSGGQGNMRINEKQVDWDEVVQMTMKDFEAKLQPAYIDRIETDFREKLEDPRSPYYFYSIEDKERVLARYLQRNYELNERMLEAAKSMVDAVRG